MGRGKEEQRMKTSFGRDVDDDELYDESGKSWEKGEKQRFFTERRKYVNERIREKRERGKRVREIGVQR